MLSLSSIIRSLATTRVRFAPSPTGFMHLGGLRMALINYLVAKKENGSFILRIEDTDRRRLVNGSVDNIIQTLHSFGMDPDEGPGHEGTFGPYIQSNRLNIYKQYASMLVENGSAYYCFCRSHQRSDSNRRCDCASLPSSIAADRVAQGESHVIRLRMRSQPFTLHDELRGDVTIQGDSIDDTVLLKSDGFPTYHLASVVDDHLMNISLVIRGEEWISSAPKHLQLYQEFGWKPPRFVHLPLLLSEQKSKISKRQGGFDIQSLLQEGFLPSALLNYVYFLGLKRGDDSNRPENGVFYSLKSIVEDFAMTKLTSTPTCVDSKLLRHFNQFHIQHLFHENPQLLIEQTQRVIMKETIPKDFQWEKFFEYTNSRIQVLRDAEFYLHQLFSPVPDLSSFPQCVAVKSFADSSLFFSSLLHEINAVDNLFYHTAIDQVLKRVGEEHKEHRKKLMAALRVGLTGSKIGFRLSEMMELMGKQRTLQRLEAICEWLGFLVFFQTL